MKTIFNGNNILLKWFFTDAITGTDFVFDNADTKVTLYSCNYKKELNHSIDGNIIQSTIPSYLPVGVYTLECTYWVGIGAKRANVVIHEAFQVTRNTGALIEPELEFYSVAMPIFTSKIATVEYITEKRYKELETSQSLGKRTLYVVTTESGVETMYLYNKPLGGSGYPADEEDITLAEKTEEVENEFDNTVEKTTKVYKFKDRNTAKGKGYIILRTEKPLAEQMMQENTIYEVRYDFDLNGETLEVPANCVLNFVGGALSNGTLNGNNTLVKGYDYAIFDNVNLKGTYSNDSVKTAWFKQSEGAVNLCQVISKHVQISDSRNYGNADLQDGCVLDVNGQDAVFDLIKTYGDYVYINLNGGAIGSTFGGGLVAETVTGGKTFKAQDGHNFYVGQRLHSSKDIGAMTYSFFGNANKPLSEPVLITNIQGNNITINKDLGTYTLHEGLGLGNTNWQRFIEAYGKRLVVSNGVIKNIYAYVCQTLSDGLVEFNNIEFKNLGLDSFFLGYYATLKFNNCIINKPIDYAKTTIMLYQGNVEVNNCKVRGGNFDYFIGCWEGAYEGDNTVDRGYIRINNSDFNGEKYDIDPGVKNNLHCFGFEKNGTFNEVTILNCKFNGYERPIFSSSTIKVDYDIHIEKVLFDNCSFTSGLILFQANSVVFDDIQIRNCVYDGNTDFNIQYIYPHIDSNIVKYTNCSFNNVKSIHLQFILGKAEFEGCHFNDCQIYRKYFALYFNNCKFDNSPIYIGNGDQQVYLGDLYKNCYFTNSNQQFTAISENTVSGVYISNSTFLGCKTVLKSENGTDFRYVTLIDSTIDSENYIAELNGWVDKIKLSNINKIIPGEQFTTDSIVCSGGSNISIKNVEGVEDFSGNTPYPPVNTESEE